MHAQFVTDLIDEQPQVLVIMNDHGLKTWLSQALQKYGLATVAVTETQIHEKLASGELTTQDWYKIVWWSQLESPQGAAPKTENLPEWLQSVTCPVVVITTLTTPITDTHPAFGAWQETAHQEMSFIQDIQRRLPQATMIVGQDVFFSAASFVPFSTLTYYMSQHMLIDPDVTFHLQTAGVFAKTILPNIMSPLPHQLLVQGKKLSSSEILRRAQLAYHRQKNILPSITTSSTTLTSLPDLPVAQNPEVESVLTFIEELPSLPITPHARVETTPTPPRPLVGRVPLAQKVNSHHPLPTTETVASVKQTPSSAYHEESVSSAAASRLTPASETTPSLHRRESLAQTQTYPAVTASPTETLTIAKTTAHAPSTPQSSSQTSGPTPSSIASPPPTTENLQSDIDLDEQVVELFQKYRSEHKVQRVEKLADTKKTVTRKLKHKKKLFWGGLAFVASGFVVIVMGLVFVLSTWGLKKAVAETLTQQLSPAIATSFLGARTPQLTSLVQTQMSIFDLVLDESFFGQAHHLTQLATALLAVQTEKSTWTEQTTLATLQLFGQSEGSSLETWGQAAVTAKNLYEDFSQVQTALKAVSSALFKSSDQEKEFEAQLVAFKRNLLPTQQLQPLFPVLLGQEQRRNYVVLFQNNQELRPTGGFIQALALVSVEEGRIINTQVFSVYELDGKVMGTVTPPADLHRFLGEQQWYLRDSNWHPDFPTTSKQVSWFVEKATGTKPDGVIAFNLLALEELLKHVGPLELPEYNEVITDRNLNERMEFHSEIQLVPDASRPDYASLILTRALERMQQAPAEKVPLLLAAIQDQLEEKQVLVTLSDSNENSSLSTLGWTGNLLKPVCPTQLSDVECRVDLLAQVETNVGVNKANAYVRRTTRHEIDIADSGYRHHRRITYTNSATSNAWPKGTYKNYLRFYASPDAQLDSIFIDQRPIAQHMIVRSVESGRQVFGVLVEVPINQEVVVDLNYTVPHSSSGRFSYAFFDQRQSGLDDPPPQVTIKYSPALNPTLIAPQAEVTDAAIVFDTTDMSHVFVGVQFE